MQPMTVRVRFAPSPTGYLHVGGARTALFNWLYARKMNGTFILRIEDTDAERSDPALTDSILDALRWMGLDWDEGPFFQSARLDAYRETASRLVEGGHAYYCFCTPELLAEKREDAARRKADWKYDRACLLLDPAEARSRAGKGIPAAIRFRVPDGPVAFTDLVYGKITRESQEIEDFVLIRSGGQPTYQIGVVVDDIEMRVSHVVRGADHLANTPKQILLYRALRAPQPEFVHVPLILGPDKSRLSKRHGATSVGAFRDEGVLAEAFDNFLVLLGWSNGTDREIFDRPSLLGAFSLKGISRTNAVFDADKLSWFNGQYIQSLAPEELAIRLRPYLEQEGLWDRRYLESDREWFLRMLELIRPRFRSLRDLARATAVYTQSSVSIDPAAASRFISEPALADYLPRLASRLEELDSFDLPSSEQVVRELADELGVRAGLLINASRAALTGQAVGPGIFDVMVTLGQARTVARIRDAAASLRI
jgi:glutamyl-tRNA synthetase